MSRYTALAKLLLQQADPKRAKLLQGFFKTGAGEYGEGDFFLGITVPQLRKLAKQFTDLSFSELRRLLCREEHEARLIALLILVRQFQKSAEPERTKIFDFYCANFKAINNWDLVDLSAPYIAGAYLYENRQQQRLLKQWARSKNLWQRRIAIIATAYFIREGAFTPTLQLATLLLNDPEDLLHKAVGWMLREVGKRDLACEERFLKRHLKRLPRTTLRYAIERFPEKKRLRYLHA